MTIRRFVMAAGAVLLGLTIGVAQADAQTLDRIIKEKKIRITAEVTLPPFGILIRVTRSSLPKVSRTTRDVLSCEPSSTTTTCRFW